jgi:hypothetical protein
MPVLQVQENERKERRPDTGLPSEAVQTNADIEIHPAQEGKAVARNASVETSRSNAGTRERSAGRRTNAPLERVTVNLNARSSQALDQAVELTGDSKTDAINRSVQLYAFIERILSGDGAVYVRESSDSELERLKLF